MKSPTLSVAVLLIGIIVVWLAVKGRIRPVWDSLLSGTKTE